MNALILSAVWGVVMMFSGVATKNNTVVRILAVTGLLLLLGASLLELNGMVLISFRLNGMLEFDQYVRVFIFIAILSTLLYLLLSMDDMERVGKYLPDYLALIFFVICGITLIASFRSLLILFLGIEIITIPVYILTASDKKNLKSNEAALKYFLLGTFSTGLMLMGVALYYGATGSFLTNVSETSHSALLWAGLLLLLFSMSFKASLAPFHFWTPDVYDGAPTVFTSFMATIVKAAVFIAFIRLFGDAFGKLQPQWQIWMALIAAATLFIGNMTAVFQQSVKRMLAYSSISQAGFMLLAVLAMNTGAKEGLLLYVAAYSFATIGIFSVLSKMKDQSFSGFNGLARQQPLLAFALVIFLLSLAGIPLTAGFLSKFYMLQATFATGRFFWLLVLAVLMAAVSVYYYFRVIQAMYFKEGDAGTLAPVTAFFKWTLLVLALLIVLLGFFPELLLGLFYF